MDNKPGKNTNDIGQELEDLEEIIKQLEEIKKQSNKQPGKKPNRKFIAFEFGGVFHHNPIINFMFLSLSL